MFQNSTYPIRWIISVVMYIRSLKAEIFPVSFIYFQCQKGTEHIVGAQYIFIEYTQKFSLFDMHFVPVVCLFSTTGACPSGIFREE